jgi:DNA repair protein RAD5
MSKRSRDDASIKAVLGDIPVHVIENLLHRSNNNVEAAVNLYFSQPQPVDPPAPKPKSQSESTLTKSSNGIRYYIGEMVLTGTINPEILLEIARDLTFK